LRIPSSSSLTIQCKDLQHHRITGSFGFKDFDGTSEESGFWSKASEEQKQALKKKHVDSGQCLLCMIDEEIVTKSPGPRQVAVNGTEQRRTTKGREELISTVLPAKKIVGGIINRAHEKAEASSSNLKVSWAWYNEDAGIVAWTFQNSGGQKSTGILSRNSYYFGNAYWPIYANNPGFGVTFAINLDETLCDNSIQNNSAPLGVISWKQSDGSYKSIVAFVFTLSPGQTWQMLEAGFSHLKPPHDIGIFEVSRVSETANDFTLTYDKEQIEAWGAQTGNPDKGYAPNPKVFNAVHVLAPSEAPFEQLFEKDSILDGRNDVVASPSAAVAPEVEEKFTVEELPRQEEQQEKGGGNEEAPIVLEAQPSSTSGSGKSLWSLLGKQSASSSGKN
jgi:hypothetical protein